MADIHSIPTDAELRREASEWIALLNADRVEAEDRVRFERWRAGHQRNSAAYDEVLSTWRRLNDTGGLVRAVALGQGFSASTQRAIQRARAVRDSGRRIALAVAASLALVALSAAWWTTRSTPHTQFQTAVGEHVAVKLPDGSSLELNSNSRARVEYGAQTRVIRLEQGEGFFSVVHDTQRPFWVVAGGSWVRAVGTAFNVDMQPSGVRVTVSEGTVKVAANAPGEAPSDRELVRAVVSVLHAGQQARVQGTSAEVRALVPAEVVRSTAWRGGTIYFKQDKLVDVVDELSRYTTLKIVIEDDFLRDFAIGGTFETNAQGAEALLTTLEDGFGLTVRREGNKAYIASSRQ